MSENEFERRCPSLEDLAALVDGRSSDSERASLMRHLASCERCMEVYAETVRFVDSEEDDESVADFEAERERLRQSRPSPAIRRRRYAWLALAAAAGLALFAWLPVRDVLSGRGLLTAELPVEQLSAHLDPAARQLAPFDATPWSYVRSDDAFTAGLPSCQRSFRAGVRAFDLHLALGRGGTQTALDILPELTALAGSFEVAEHVVYSFDYVRSALDRGERPEDLLPASAQASAYLDDVAESDCSRLGRWAGAGRAAAATGDLSFLNRSVVRDLPRRVRPEELSAQALDALDETAAVLAEEVSSGDLEELEASFAKLLALGGNP